MTKEQETIERLNRFKTIKVLYGNTFAMHIEQLKVLQEDIETILNMLKKMKTQEENYKNLIADVSRIAKELGLEEDGTIDEIYAKIKEKDKEIEKKDSKIKILEQLYKNIKSDFDDYKNNKDINYLDGIHHKELVKKSIGQIIDKPEECWFDKIEVKVMKNDILHKVDINDDFITLKQISDSDPDACITVIAESPLSGAIYRYNNYGDKKWQLIGTMLGYA